LHVDAYRDVASAFGERLEARLAREREFTAPRAPARRVPDVFVSYSR